MSAADATSYGAEVLDVVQEVLGMPEVEQTLSAPTQASIGAVAVSAFELVDLVGDSLGGDSVLEDALTELVGEVAVEVVGELAGAIPIVGAAIDLVTGIVGAFGAAAEAEAAEKAKREAECKEEASRWGLGEGSGPARSYRPADLWVQARYNAFSQLIATDENPRRARSCG